jgi:hypothetical protein
MAYEEAGIDGEFGINDGTDGNVNGWGANYLGDLKVSIEGGENSNTDPSFDINNNYSTVLELPCLQPPLESMSTSSLHDSSSSSSLIIAHPNQESEDSTQSQLKLNVQGYNDQGGDQGGELLVPLVAASDSNADLSSFSNRGWDSNSTLANNSPHDNNFSYSNPLSMPIGTYSVDTLYNTTPMSFPQQWSLNVQPNYMPAIWTNMTAGLSAQAKMVSTNPAKVSISPAELPPKKNKKRVYTHL